LGQENSAGQVRIPTPVCHTNDPYETHDPEIREEIYRLGGELEQMNALAILEATTLEFKERDTYTPAVGKALDFLQPRIRAEWLIPGFRYHAELTEKNEVDVDKEAQQQALRATFSVIRDSVKDLIGKQIDALALQFVATHDIKVIEEIDRLGVEYGKLKEPWVFVAG
jgi:hypothetical protein